ncbi:hypothetical protein B0T18DRAFT_431430 [Schizothecium vesticola]|uniref:Uncharacterized protein n=1 Tax=Schizothecium vesticola TaxID=314040 RepID=A0AA40BTF8_9PEZI|nr:hypothetical protein B0T18DRAFT_431430 [Schizothecium vesticola]
MPLWPFSSRARADRADRKARERRRARARADAEWEGLCLTGGTAVPGTEPYDGALRRDRRPRWGSASQSNPLSGSKPFDDGTLTRERRGGSAAAASRGGNTAASRGASSTGQQQPTRATARGEDFRSGRPPAFSGNTATPRNPGVSSFDGRAPVALSRGTRRRGERAGQLRHVKTC